MAGYIKHVMLAQNKEATLIMSKVGGVLLLGLLGFLLPMSCSDANIVQPGCTPPKNAGVPVAAVFLM